MVLTLSGDDESLSLLSLLRNDYFFIKKIIIILAGSDTTKGPRATRLEIKEEPATEPAKHKPKR